MKFLLLIVLVTGCAGLKPLYREPSVVVEPITNPHDIRSIKMEKCIEKFLRYGIKFIEVSKECDERIYKHIER